MAGLGGFRELRERWLRSLSGSRWGGEGVSMCDRQAAALKGPAALYEQGGVGRDNI